MATRNRAVPVPPPFRIASRVRVVDKASRFADTFGTILRATADGQIMVLLDAIQNERLMDPKQLELAEED